MQKYLEVEDAREEEIKDLQSKTESLESIVRMFELKAKNAQDHSMLHELGICFKLHMPLVLSMHVNVNTNDIYVNLTSPLLARLKLILIKLIF